MSGLPGILLLILITLSNASPAQALETLRVVYTPWFPYTYSENGEAKGYEIDILRAVFERMDVDAEFIELPWKRCLEHVRYGDADALSSMLKTPERAKYAWFPETNISFSRVVLFTSKDSPVEFNGSFESLAGLRVGYWLGFNYGEEFERADYLVKDRGLDIKDIVNKVINGHDDLGIANEAVLRASARQLGVLDRIRTLDPPVFTKPLFVVFSKKTVPPDFVDAFSAALADFMLTDQYRAISEAYALPSP